MVKHLVKSLWCTFMVQCPMSVFYIFVVRWWAIDIRSVEFRHPKNLTTSGENGEPNRNAEIWTCRTWIIAETSNGSSFLHGRHWHIFRFHDGISMERKPHGGAKWDDCICTYMNGWFWWDQLVTSTFPSWAEFSGHAARRTLPLR